MSDEAPRSRVMGSLLEHCSTGDDKTSQTEIKAPRLPSPSQRAKDFAAMV